MEPGTRVRLVALPVERWTPWPDGALPADEIARRAGEMATVIPGHDYLPDGCVLLVVDANAASAEDDGEGVPTLYGLIAPIAAVARVEPEAAPHAPLLPDPWRPGAHDEERLAVGGRQQVVTCDRYPPDNTPPDSGHEPAPAGAGRWSFAGLTPVTDYTGDAPTTYTTKAWTRWLVPVLSAETTADRALRRARG